MHHVFILDFMYDSVERSSGISVCVCVWQEMTNSCHWILVHFACNSTLSHVIPLTQQAVNNMDDLRAVLFSHS